MLIRPIRDQEAQAYDQVVNYPTQAWAWGEFRKLMGHSIERVGFFEQGKLKKAFQIAFHRIPVINKQAGYLARGFMPDQGQLAALQELALKHNCLFIKLEPNVAQKTNRISAHQAIVNFLKQNHAVPARPLFHKHTFIIDLTKSEEELFANLAAKTRYNIRLAIKKGVQIYENTSKEGMEEYIKILQETTKRQNFYAHSPEYFRKMWQVMAKTGMMRIFQAVYQNQILVSWIMFVFNNNLYYPYGASRNIHREVMASNLMMWEMIRFGQKMNLKKFDLWGCLGENPDHKNPWYGFHKFKKGYGGDLYEFLGSYDLIYDQFLYKLFRIVENLRWKVLKVKAKLNL